MNVFAHLLNEIFDLGLNKREVNVENIRKALKSATNEGLEVLEIWRRRSQNLQYNSFSATRNSIIHEGAFNDSELNAILSQIPSVKLKVALFYDEESKSQ